MPKIKKCKYCGSTENLKEGRRKDKLFYYPVCEKHWEIYQKQKANNRQKTVLKKYGVTNIAKLEEIKEKTKITNLTKYGTDNPSRNKNVIEERKKTNQLRYGGNAPACSQQVRSKQRESCLKNYGVDNVLKVPSIRNKAIQTIKEKYGVDNVFKSPEIQNKIKSTNIQKYGHPYAFQNEEIKRKAVVTNKERHGTSYPQQSVTIKEKTRMSHRKKYWKDFLKVLKKKDIIPDFTKDDYIQNTNNYDRFKCQSCTTIFYSEETNPHNIYCNCKRSRSYFESEIADWLNSIGIDKIDLNKKFYDQGKYKYEIDVYIQDHNLGIEFCGIYWHCDFYRDKFYHQKKYLFFTERNIQLIQIFETEWLSKKDIVKSIIKNYLGLSSVIYARKCLIKNVDNIEYLKFLEENHLQGKAPASVKLGLYFEKNLVCLAAFSKNRFSTGGFELVRFCTKINYAVVGGLQRLIKHFLKQTQPTQLVSFVDLRYFNGHGLYQSGFKKEHITSPNYYYFSKKHPDILYNRIRFQKHKLKNLLETFDSSLSEYQNMLNNDYLRIFDAGNLKMIIF